MKKIVKNPKILFPFFMALFMAFLMSGFLTLINLGLVDGFFFKWMKGFVCAFIIAFPVAYFVAPIVQKIVKKIVES